MQFALLVLQLFSAHALNHTQFSSPIYYGASQVGLVPPMSQFEYSNENESYFEKEVGGKTGSVPTKTESLESSVTQSAARSAPFTGVTSTVPIKQNLVYFGIDKNGVSAGIGCNNQANFRFGHKFRPTCNPPVTIAAETQGAETIEAMDNNILDIIYETKVFEEVLNDPVCQRVEDLTYELTEIPTAMPTTLTRMVERTLTYTVCEYPVETRTVVEPHTLYRNPVDPEDDDNEN